MLDTRYIDELRNTDEYTVAEAKEALKVYAETFNIKLSKKLSFDNMVADFEKKLKELADIPEYENPVDGLSTLEVIDKYSDKDKLDEELLIDSPLVNDIVAEDLKEAVEEAVSPAETTETPAETVVKEEVVQSPTEVVEPEIRENTSVQDTYELPSNFRPKLALMGGGSGYVIIAFPIYDWISKTEDWKNKVMQYPHKQDIAIIQTLLYYINKHGNVKIRETRNSRFYTIE